jgi:hypothetical protein
MKKFSFIIEPILFLIPIIACGFLIGSPGFIEYHFHPFYFVILVVTMRYGYGKGVYSMLFSITFFILFFVFEKGYSYIDFFELWKRYYQPITFFVFWMFIGLLVNIDKKKITKLVEDNSKHRKALNNKLSEVKKLYTINENISKELINSDQSFSTLFDKTKNLFNDDINIIYDTAYELLIKIIQASEAYVLYIEGDRIEMVSPGNADLNKRYLNAHNNEIDEVIRSHKFTKIDMLNSSSISSQTPVFIGPIIHQQTDTLFGLLIVQELDYLKYNNNTFRTFVNLGKWLGEIFYFRTRLNLAIVPLKSGVEFDYLVEYGASRSKINVLVEECFR